MEKINSDKLEASNVDIRDILTEFKQFGIEAKEKGISFQETILMVMATTIGLYK